MKLASQIVNVYEDNKVSHPVDRYVGDKVRVRRKQLGLSQSALAEAINLTFQQVQKYERGSNRISASKLFEMSHFLKVPISYFFEGATSLSLDETLGFAADTSAQGVSLPAERIELANVFPRLKSMEVRRRILDLVRSLAED